MAGTLFQRGGQTHCLLLVNAPGRYHGNHLRFTFGQRAGFIEHHRVEGAGALQRIGITHQRAKLGGAAYAGDNRHRRGQAQRARTGDNQYRGGDHQGIHDLRCRAEEVPDSAAEQRNQHHDRDKHRGDAVGEFADFRLTALGLAHHANNARQSGMVADGAGAEQDAAILHHGPGVDAFADAFLLRYRLAGQHRFIKPGFTLGDFAIGRNAIAGSQAQRHAWLHFRQWQRLLAVFGDHARGGRCEIKQPFQRF